MIFSLRKDLHRKDVKWWYVPGFFWQPKTSDCQTVVIVDNRQYSVGSCLYWILDVQCEFVILQSSTSSVKLSILIELITNAKSHFKFFIRPKAFPFTSPSFIPVLTSSCNFDCTRLNPAHTGPGHQTPEWSDTWSFRIIESTGPVLYDVDSLNRCLNLAGYWRTFIQTPELCRLLCSDMQSNRTAVISAGYLLKNNEFWYSYGNTEQNDCHSANHCQKQRF